MSRSVIERGQRVPPAPQDLAALGTVIASDPSFAVEATTVVQFAPLSVERLIFTFAAVLPPLVQVTVCVELPDQETAVFGAVTEKGPATNPTVIVALV